MQLHVEMSLSFPHAEQCWTEHFPSSRSTRETEDSYNRSVASRNLSGASENMSGIMTGSSMGRASSFDDEVFRANRALPDATMTQRSGGGASDLSEQFTQVMHLPPSSDMVGPQTHAERQSLSSDHGRMTDERLPLFPDNVMQATASMLFITTGENSQCAGPCHTSAPCREVSVLRITPR